MSDFDFSADHFEWAADDAADLSTVVPCVDALALSLIASSPDCLKILDSEGRLAFMSKNGQCAMDVPDFSVLRGQVWASAWPEEVAAIIPGMLAEAAHGAPQSFCAGTTTLRGIYKVWDVTITPLSFGPGNGTGAATHFVANSRDVTDDWREGRRKMAIIGEAHMPLARKLTELSAVA